MDTKPNRFPLVMRSVALLTALVTGMLTVLYHFLSLDWLLSAAITFGTMFYHFAMRLLVGAIVPRFTKNADPSRHWFLPRRWEEPLYRKLGVKNWKKDLPTYDPGQFDLRKHTLEQVIRNMCNAELVHEVIILFSFVPLLFAIPFGTFPVFLITSVLAALYDSVFVIAQRYNRPRLERILKKKKAKVP